MGSFSLASILRKPPTAPRTNPAREAVRFGDAALTYDQLDDRSSRLAAGLVERGLQKGDRVAILMHNRLEWVELFFALAKAGAVMVPLNYLLRPQELRYILDDCGASWLVCEDGLFGALSDLAVSDVTVVMVGEERDATVAYETLVTEGDSEIDDRGDLDDLFLLQYTSGTTGFPKGAMHTHSTVLWNTVHQIPDFGVTADDVYLVVPALCWAAGFHDLALATLWAGGRVVLHPSTGFDASSFLETIERERVSKTLLVPSVLKRVLGAPDFDQRDLSCLQLVISGGEPVPVPAIEEFTRRLPGCTMAQVYGMSEFPTLMLLLDSSDATRKAGSTGKACRAAEIRVVEAGDREGAPGEAQPLPHAPARAVAGQDAAARAADDHQPAIRELPRVESEHERPAHDEQLDPRRRGDGGIACDGGGECPRQLRGGEVRDAALEEPEVCTADVDQVLRRPLHPRRDREQRVLRYGPADVYCGVGTHGGICPPAIAVVHVAARRQLGEPCAGGVEQPRDAPGPDDGECVGATGAAGLRGVQRVTPGQCQPERTFWQTWEQVAPLV